jgi:hypothetical protein
MKLEPGIIVVVAGLLLVVNPVAALSQHETKKEKVVIGSNQAKAALAEERRKQKGDSGKSPMPAPIYDFWRGEGSLVNPVKNSLDSELSELCERFEKSDAKLRAKMRTSISMDEFYTLLLFSKRSAVFAIRERDLNWLGNGLTAVAMIEAERTDVRDILWALSLLYHSARRVGADANQLFRAAAKLSEPHVSKLLTGFIGRPAKEKDLRSSWGYDEVETKDGTGFIGWGFADYRPTCDLKRIVIDIGDLVEKDKYQTSSVEVAAELPPVWLQSKENRSIDLTLKKVRAGASVHADLRPNEHPTYKSQVLMVFLVEVEDERVAQELLGMSRQKKPTDYSMIGIAEGRLFCLLVARSFVHGVESFETSESVLRFEKGITEILGRYSKTG